MYNAKATLKTGQEIRICANISNLTDAVSIAHGWVNNHPFPDLVFNGKTAIAVTWTDGIVINSKDDLGESVWSHTLHGEVPTTHKNFGR